MNTGIQRSSATPMYADTTTTPAGRQSFGKEQNRKDLASVIAAHNIPYVAQSTFIGNMRSACEIRAGDLHSGSGISECNGAVSERVALSDTGDHGDLQDGCGNLLLAAV